MMVSWFVRACCIVGAAACAAPAAADSIDGLVNPASAIRVTVSRLAFSGLGAASAKTFMVTKQGYTRTFNASSRTCGQGDGAIARFTPDAHAGPAATFTVTPLNPGNCSIAVSDDGSGSVRVQVDVQGAAGTPRPPSPSASP